MLTVKIKTNNNAFTDNIPAECARILRELADRLENEYEQDGGLRDYNGNTVGSFTLTTR